MAGVEPRESIRKEVHTLLSGRRLAVLSTHGAGHPYANLVAFCASEDLRFLYFATPRSTRKFANLSADGRMALLISSSTDQVSDFHEAMAVTAVGSGGEIGGEERARALGPYLAKHPYLEDFVRAPSCALVKFIARTYILVKNFQNVMELHIEP
jgi:hypothetical protein